MPLATYSEAFKEYARNAGADQPESAWILTPWDTWERNPTYSGPPQPHPESDEDHIEDRPKAKRPENWGDWATDDDIPF